MIDTITESMNPGLVILLVWAVAIAVAAFVVYSVNKEEGEDS